MFLVLLDTPSEPLSTDTSVMDSDEGQQQLQANESDDSLWYEQWIWVRNGLIQWIMYTGHARLQYIYFGFYF